MAHIYFFFLSSVAFWSSSRTRLLSIYPLLLSWITLQLCARITDPSSLNLKHVRQRFFMTPMATTLPVRKPIKYPWPLSESYTRPPALFYHPTSYETAMSNGKLFVFSSFKLFILSLSIIIPPQVHLFRPFLWWLQLKHKSPLKALCTQNTLRHA